MDLDNDENLSWLALARAPGVGSRTAVRLLSHFGSASAAAGAGGRQLREAGLGEASIAWLDAPDTQQLRADQNWLSDAGHHLVSIGSPFYPPLLLEIPDPPALLYVAGDPEVLAAPQLAIVGSRHPTAGGRETAHAFARHLARCGLPVTSGLAAGIDAAAHRGALAGGGLTVAVLGTGADVVYPAGHDELMADIARDGVVVSEFPPGTPPRRENFPRRNRIISGMALGTLVVEAAERSGSLITARLAGEQGREVFAIPGSIHNPMAKGCHRLIRDGAKLVQSANDILEELGPMAAVSARPAQRAAEGATGGREAGTQQDPEYQQLLQALGFEPVGIDTLIARAGLTPESVSSMLLILELQGQVRPVPGGLYERTSNLQNSSP